MNTTSTPQPGKKSAAARIAGTFGPAGMFVGGLSLMFPTIVWHAVAIIFGL